MKKRSQYEFGFVKVALLLAFLLSGLVLGCTSNKANVAGSALSNRSTSSYSSGSSLDSDSVWVGKPDGAMSCSPESGLSLSEGEGELEKAGISVLASKKGSDGKIYIQTCGAPQGSTNSYQIRRSELPKALGLGFREVSPRE